MSIFMRTPIIISVLTAIYIYISVYPSFALQDTGLDRQRHLRAISVLEEDADRLAQELLAFDLKVKKAEQERALIEKELVNTRIMKDEAISLHKSSLESKGQALKKISLWVNFQYRYGYWGLLDVIIGSDSLSDLISRSMVVAVILDRMGKDFRAAAEACETSRLREKALADLEDRLNAQNQSLTEQIASIRSLSEERLKYLEEIKSSSRELAVKVEALERKFLKSLKLVDLLTGALAGFSWREIRPDRVSFQPGGILVELSETTVNRSIQESGIKGLEGLSVNLRDGLFIINGRDKNSTSVFTLAGVLVPSTGSKTVRLSPKSLSLDGVPVAGEIVRELAGSSAFYLPIPEDMSSFKPSKIEITNGKMDITLTI